jgi:hypothetical protein
MAVSIISTIKKICNKLISLNNSKIDIAAFQKLYGSRETLVCGCTPTANWNAPTANSAILMGDKILVSITIKRKSNYAAGNITNERIGVFTIKTKDSILNAYSCSIPKAYTGQMVAVTYGTEVFSFTGSGDEKTLQYDLQLNANHAAGSEISFRFMMPVRPNLSYFGF